MREQIFFIIMVYLITAGAFCVSVQAASDPEPVVVDGMVFGFATQEPKINREHLYPLAIVQTVAYQT